MEIGKILKYKKGKAPSSAKAGNDYVIYLSPEYLRNKAAPTFIPDFTGKVEADENDFLLLWDGSNAGEFFIGKKGILSSTMVKLLFNEDVFDRSFFYYQLKFIETYLKSQTNGSGIPHVDKEILLSIDIQEFSKPEQRQIARILSKVDEAISQTEQLIAKYRRLKTGLMQDLLIKGIDAHGSIRSEETHAFKDSPLGRIPAEWRVEKLNKVCSDIVDCPHSTPTYLEEGVLVARTMHIKNGGYDVANSSFVSEDEYLHRILRKQPKAGDIIFTREAPVGEAFVIPKGMKICLGQRVMLIRVNENIKADFLLELIYSDDNKAIFDNMVSGTTNPHLNVKDVRELFFKVPEVDEQKRIMALILKQRSSLDSFRHNLTKLQSLKTGLMQDLLSGQVGVGQLIRETAAI